MAISLKVFYSFNDPCLHTKFIEVELRKNSVACTNPSSFPDTKLQVYVGSKPKVCIPYIDKCCAVVPVLLLVKFYQTYTFRAIMILQYLRKTSLINHIFPLSMGKPATNKKSELSFNRIFIFYFYFSA